jgi:hypothetical protein
VTDRQLNILQHSLGVDQYGRGEQYRNHFVAGGDDITTCRELVALGYMQESDSYGELSGNMPCFFVSDAGKKAMRDGSPKPPKITAGQKRYHEWLEVADCYPDWKFGDWLKHAKGDQP